MWKVECEKSGYFLTVPLTLLKLMYLAVEWQHEKMGHVAFTVKIYGLAMFLISPWKHTVNVLKFRTLYSILFWPKFCFLCSGFILSGKANSVDPDQTAPSGAVWSGSAQFAYAVLSDTLVFDILVHLPYIVGAQKQHCLSEVLLMSTRKLYNVFAWGSKKYIYLII